ncbi:MAG TPA: helix-turn-helix transcriptional regulator [Polyangiaceae bacterium]
MFNTEEFSPAAIVRASFMTTMGIMSWPTPGAALQRILEALGGTRRLARECEVSTWTVRAWLRGERLPSPDSQHRICGIAQGLGVPSPYEWQACQGRRRLDS